MTPSASRTGGPARAMAVVLLLALATACGSGSENPNHPLGRLLIDDGPEGYARVEPPATGPMNLGTAATSTEASQTKVRRQLGTTGFQQGYARVWESGEEFVAVLVYEFFGEDRAEELVTFMADQLADKSNAHSFKVPDVPGAEGTTLNARNNRGTSLFCQVAWFSIEERAFTVRACNTSPGSPDQAIELAQKQYRHASDH